MPPQLLIAAHSKAIRRPQHASLLQLFSPSNMHLGKMCTTPEFFTTPRQVTIDNCTFTSKMRGNPCIYIDHLPHLFIWSPETNLVLRGGMVSCGEDSGVVVTNARVHACKVTVSENKGFG